MSKLVLDSQIKNDTSVYRKKEKIKVLKNNISYFSYVFWSYFEII